MSAGYLIATRFDVLYDAALRSGKYDDNQKTNQPIYGLPHKSRPVLPPDMPQYRGTYRKPLWALSFENARRFTELDTPCEANEATAMLDEIESATGREDGWVTVEDEILRVWNALGDDQPRYEIIFGNEWGDAAKPPPGAQFLGCDSAYFAGNHFSCICDAMFLPQWHGTDPEGVLFKEHFRKLNRNGLFNTNAEALDFLRYYLSFDWTEHDDNLTSIEVYALHAAGT